MKVKDLTLEDWQRYAFEFNGKMACFRIDGTIFSTARHYGGFTMGNRRYTVFGYNWHDKYAGALIGVREDLLKYVTNKLKQERTHER